MAKREPDEKTKKVVYAICGVIVVITVVACFAIIGSAASSDDSSSAQPAATGNTEQQAPDQAAQVFDNEFATVEYRDTIDSTGNAIVSFALTNKTGSRVVVNAEHIVVNDQFNVQTLGGSVAPIDPGNTGSVSLAFGVNVQTTLAGVSDVHTLSADLVMHDESTFDVVGSVPVSITI